MLALRIVSVKLPRETIEVLNMLVRNGKYYSKSQIIRRALIEFLKSNTMSNKIPNNKIKKAIRALEAITY